MNTGTHRVAGVQPRRRTCGGGLPRALKNVRTVIALGRLGKLLPAAKQAGVERVVMLSTAGELWVFVSGGRPGIQHQRRMRK